MSDVVPGLRDDVEGWLTPGQAAMLADAAAAVPAQGEIVEIGSFQGRSTLVLAAAAPGAATIVTIDPHAGNDRGPNEMAGYADDAAADRDAFERNLERAGVRHRVRHIASFSGCAHDAVPGPIDLLYIDGAHRYAPARADVRDWGAKVVPGGTMLIHDSFSSVGVTRAIIRELMFATRFRYVGRSRSLALYRADLRGGGWARARNTARQLWQLGWFVRNIAVKVGLSVGVGRLLTSLGRSAPEWPY